MRTIVIRAKDLKQCPDVEKISQKLHEEKILKNLADTGKLEPKELEQFFPEDIASIYVDDFVTDFESGDILIFESGNFTIYTGEGVGE